ncbi:hypothetical protein ANO14919_022500 [Xylariales sp. No.14919]|nr:hypothetical protein ANO14919_022500 [Xylariales sp. No.14919]
MEMLLDFATTFSQYSWLILYHILIILPTLIYFHVRFRAPAYARPKDDQKHSDETPNKLRRGLALRITGIPIHRSCEDVAADLKHLFSTSPGLNEAIISFSVHSVIPMGRETSCSVVTVCASISQDFLLSSLRGAQCEPKYEYDIEFLGITPIYQGCEGAKVDVIAVHGLASHAIGGWKSPNSHEVWLRDYLPKDLPDIRVLLYGYDTKLLGGQSRKSIENMGHYFLEILKEFRAIDGTHRRPIIFIGHSLGGLLIKEALVRAHQQPNNSSSLELCESSYGMVFFGVPNFGLRNIQLQSIVDGLPNQNLINTLVVDNDSEPSPYLRRLTKDFAGRCKEKYQVVSFFETKHSPTVIKQGDGTLRKNGPSMLMVTEASATNVGLTSPKDEDSIALDTSHSELVKYHSRSDGNYIIVKGRLSSLMSTAALNDELTEAQRLLWNKINSPPYSSFRDSTRLSKPAQGSLEWLLGSRKLDNNSECITDSLHSDDFTFWRDSNESSCLLITGGAGAGKSVLSNFILDHLGKATAQDKSTRILYHFCNIRDDIPVSSRNGSFIFRSLIVQLIEKSRRLFQHFLLTNPDETAFDNAGFHSLARLFKEIFSVGMYSKVYCIIDGLDVYANDMEDFTKELLNIYQTSIHNPGVTLKLICTARPQRRIVDSWGEEAHRILRCDRRDVEIFTESRVKSLHVGENVKKEIVKRLNAVEHRTFLWIDVVIRRVQQYGFVPTGQKLMDVIENSSHDLYGLYAELVRDAVQRDESSARLLVWVVYARRALICEELGEAISFGPTDRLESYRQLESIKTPVSENLIHRCLGTILDVVDGKVYLIHQSIKDFMEERQPLQQIFGSLSPRLFPAFVCMKYLQFNDIVDQCMSGIENIKNLHWMDAEQYRLASKSFKWFPLLHYAARNWHFHIESAQDIYDETLLQQLLARIVNPSSRITTLWTNFQLIRSGSAGLMLFSHIAIKYDIGWLAKIILDRKTEGIDDDFDRELFYTTTPLHFSILKECIEHERLSEFKAPWMPVLFLTKVKDAGYMVPLLKKFRSNSSIMAEAMQQAAGNERHGAAIMEALLEMQSTETKVPKEVLYSAASNAGDGYKVLELLFERSRNITICEGTLALAARNEESGDRILDLLFRKGADIGVMEDGSSPLHLAIEAKSLKAVNTLLDRGANIEAVSKYGTTPLMLASGEGLDEIVEVLIERGARLDASGGHETTPLSLAAAMGHFNTLKILSAKGAGLGQMGSDGLTLLHPVCLAGSIEMVQFVLENGAEVNAATNTGRTPCHYAASGGNLEVIKLLHESGASVIAAEDNGYTPLHYAASGGHVEVVRFLLQNGAAVNETIHHGCTPLLMASQKGHIEVVKLLLEESMLDPNISDHDGDTALSLALEHKHEGIVELLLQDKRTKGNSQR